MGVSGSNLEQCNFQPNFFQVGNGKILHQIRAQEDLKRGLALASLNTLHVAIELGTSFTNKVLYIIYNIIIRSTELENRTAPNNSVNRNSVFIYFGAVFGFEFLKTENSEIEFFGAV